LPNNRDHDIKRHDKHLIAGTETVEKISEALYFAYDSRHSLPALRMQQGRHLQTQVRGHGQRRKNLSK
jgi:hypothetical protein